MNPGERDGGHRLKWLDWQGCEGNVWTDEVFPLLFASMVGLTCGLIRLLALR
jgi:hypothetical protein